MTLLGLTDVKLPPVQPFLNTVYPGLDYLDENIHFKLDDTKLDEFGSSPFKKIKWPTSQNCWLQLQPYYFNIARPPLTSQESNTYVSIPYHINKLFTKVSHTNKNLENARIGANINPLNHDPMKTLVNGCFTKIIEIAPSSLNNNFESSLFELDVLQSHESIKDLSFAKKLIVAANINVLNLFALDASSQYCHSTTIQTSKSTFPFVEEDGECKKTIERPLLRLQFQNNVTCLKASFPLIVLGFDNGDLLLIDLIKLSYKFIKIKDLNSCVTSIEIVFHPRYPYLMFVGLGNGEVLIFNPSNLSTDMCHTYARRVVGSDSKMTVFKKFDLSIYTKPDLDELIIGHIKLSYTAITSITSTLPFNSKTRESFETDYFNPMVIAMAGRDGFVRFIDLMFTYEGNYATNDIKNNSIITDIISNYFNDGISMIQYSPDFKFLAVVGNGDLVEIFKFTYYNVNGLLKKKDDPVPTNTQLNPLQSQTSLHGRRSRSGTVNSTSSAHRGTGPKTRFPPLIKDINIACRLKGHSNSVHHVQFLLDYNYRLISCGYDGKIILWEFDYKALPKLKFPKTLEKDTERRRRRSMHRKQPSLISSQHSPSPVARRNPSVPAPGVFLQTARSLHDDSINGYLNTNMNGTNTSMNTILNEINNTNVLDDTKQQQDPQIEIVNSIYKSLFDLRVRRQYKNTTRQPLIIHPIVDDKLVPSIEIPLMSLDLSCYINDGKIGGSHLDDKYFWCFGKNGDIFKYEIITT
jgi:hypothetical protein